MRVLMKTEINAASAEVWKIISDFNLTSKYIDAVESSDMEGSGVGAIRTLTLKDGVQVVERLESMDDQAKILSYSIIKSALPIDDYVSTMKVRDIDNNRCELEWSSIFKPRGVSEDEAEKIPETIYAMGFEGIKRLLGTEK